MLALVAVDQHGVISPVQDGSKCRCDGLTRNLYKRFFVAGDSVLKEPDTIFIQKLNVLFGVIFKNKRQNAS